MAATLNSTTKIHSTPATITPKPTDARSKRPIKAIGSASSTTPRSG
jgi:hypothetical protein